MVHANLCCSLHDTRLAPACIRLSFTPITRAQYVHHTCILRATITFRLEIWIAGILVGVSYHGVECPTFIIKLVWSKIVQEQFTKR